MNSKLDNSDRRTIFDVIKIFLSQKKAYIISNVIISIIIFLIIFTVGSLIHLNFKVTTGKFLIVLFSIGSITCSVLYVVFYKYYIEKKDIIKRFKYLFISISFGIFLLYYYYNLDDILQAVTYYPSWIKKSTFVLLVYIGVFFLIEVIIFTLLDKNINSLKVGVKGVEVAFEKDLVKKLEEISVNISDVLSNNIMLMDNIDEVITREFEKITLSDFINIDTYFEFIKNTSVKVFIDMKIDVTVMISLFEEIVLLDKVFECMDSSIIKKINSIKYIENDNIVRLEKYIFIPIVFESINKKVLYIIEFNNSKECVADFGNLMYTTLKYIDCCVLKYLQGKALDELDKLI